MTLYSNRRRSAFSLVELATLTCLLTALVALLAPAMTKMSADSKVVRCRDHLGRIGQASLFYSTIDPNEYLIPVHPLQFNQPQNDPTFIGVYEYGGKSGRGRTGFCQGDPDSPLTSRFGTRCGFGPSTRPLNEILYGSVFPNYQNGSDADQLRDATLKLDVYECPSDQGYVGAHCPDWRDSRLTSYDHFGTSYNANVFMIGPSSGECLMNSNSPYLRPRSRIPTPARTLAYMENAGRWAWAVAPDWCDFLEGVDPGTPSGTVGGWHGKDWTYNAAFCDGHVEAITMKRYFPIGSPTTFPWDMFINYRCVIIRGDTWQIDTLPAPTIHTGLLCPTGGRPSYENCVDSAPRPDRDEDVAAPPAHYR